MTFRNKAFQRFGNHYNVVGTSVNVYQWNTGKNASFLVTAGYRNSDHIEKSFPKGNTARDDAINFALSLKERYTK